MPPNLSQVSKRIGVFILYLPRVIIIRKMGPKKDYKTRIKVMSLAKKNLIYKI